MKRTERTRIVGQAIMDERSADPNEDTFTIAQRVMAAAERFLPPPESDERDDLDKGQ